MASYDLPDDLFSEGDVKPTRPPKKKTANSVTKKRAATEVCNVSASAMHIYEVWSVLIDSRARSQDLITVLTMCRTRMGCLQRGNNKPLCQLHHKTCAKLPKSVLYSPIDRPLTTCLFRIISSDQPTTILNAPSPHHSSQKSEHIIHHYVTANKISSFHDAMTRNWLSKHLSICAHPLFYTRDFRDIRI
jgi:hypothetical protein